MPADLSTRAREVLVEECAKNTAENYASMLREGKMRPNSVAWFQAIDAMITLATEHASQAVAAEPEAWLVEWVVNGETWVEAFANEPSAIDRARQHGGTCTPLYRRNDGGNHG